ncbi:MAG: DNA polymerase III subunit chi [Steroidobacter sp.]
MPRVDFYVLAEGAPDARFKYACRLAEEFVSRGGRLYLQTANATDTRRVDDLLWTCSDGSFLPHEIFTGAEASHARVMILIGESLAPASHRDLLINLTKTIPPNIEDYERIAEIVEADPERKRTARDRYKQYRERGCALESHNV